MNRAIRRSASSASCRRRGLGERRAELEIVAIGIAEIQRLGGNPVVHHRSRARDAARLQALGGALDLDWIDGEREVLQRPIGAVLLQDDHASRAAGTQKQPLPLFVAQSDIRPSYDVILLVRLVYISASRGDFVLGLELYHLVILLATLRLAPVSSMHPHTLLLKRRYDQFVSESSNWPKHWQAS